MIVASTITMVTRAITKVNCIAKLKQRRSCNTAIDGKLLSIKMG